MPPRLFTLSRVSLFLLLAYWFALVLGTHLPVESLPTQFDLLDKVVHFAAYAGLAGLALLAWVLAGFRFSYAAAAWLWLALLLHAAADEITQGLVPGRQPDAWDWLADGIGVGIGVLAFGVAHAWWKSRAGFEAPNHKLQITDKFEIPMTKTSNSTADT